MDFIPDLSTFERDFCAAVNLEPVCNKKKNSAYLTQSHLLYLKFSKWNDLLKVKSRLYKDYNSRFDRLRVVPTFGERDTRAARDSENTRRETRAGRKVRLSRGTCTSLTRLSLTESRDYS